MQTFRRYPLTRMRVVHLLSLRGCMSTTLSKPVVDEGRRTGVASDSGDEWKGGGGTDRRVSAFFWLGSSPRREKGEVGVMSCCRCYFGIGRRTNAAFWFKIRQKKENETCRRGLFTGKTRAACVPLFPPLSRARRFSFNLLPLHVTSTWL